MTPAPHAAPGETVVRGLGTDAEHGLTAAEAAARLEQVGRNEPSRQRRPRYAQLALHQVVDPLVALLVAATAISVAMGDTTEGIAIAAILVLNGVLGFWQEAGAERAILALSTAFSQSALVVRDGAEAEIDAAEVVPGDVLLVQAGDRVAADARIVATNGLDVDESALTGESLPAAKTARPVPEQAPLAERASMLYAGTGVTRGAARAVVTDTGSRTELGRIETLAAAAKAPTTPLTRRLGALAQQMVVVGVAVTLVLGAIIVVRGGAWNDAFLTSVAVAVAAVPEGLAATVTAALALGARAMAKRGAIVRRLSAIETLGETTEICTDKTGTLTQNEIRVADLRTAADVGEGELLRAAVFASSTIQVAGRAVGDPIEVALELAALERGALDGGAPPVVGELAFSAERKRMTVVRAVDGAAHAFTKGAPEAVAACAEEAPPALVAAAEGWAAEGFRVLAVATRPLAADAAVDETVEAGLRMIGVVALHDPLRASAAPSVAAARDAGIHVRMITGDHPATAATIGRALGLDADAIHARATPADKLALVEELQAGGAVVAVTGDGVNDAPALRRADIGVAMGRSGTEAAREAATIVLTDDDFATIVAAVAEGRRIGDNIRKFVAFLVSANFGEVLVFAVAVTAGMGAPLAVIQVLLVNLVTDGLPALALARDPGMPETMHSPPRRGTVLFDRRMWQALGAIGVVVGAATLTAFLIGRGSDDDVAKTMAFATLALSELALVYGMRSPTVAAWHAPRNRWLDLSVVGSVAVVAFVVYFPGGHSAFGTVSLGVADGVTSLLLALAPLAAVETFKALRRRPPFAARPRDVPAAR
jgi:Ca2+-transporting ATPase